MKTYSVEDDDADDGVLADVGGGGCGAACDTVVAAEVGGSVKFNLFFFMVHAKKKSSTNFSVFFSSIDFYRFYIENSLYTDGRPKQFHFYKLNSIILHLKHTIR